MDRRPAGQGGAGAVSQLVSVKCSAVWSSCAGDYLLLNCPSLTLKERESARVRPGKRARPSPPPGLPALHCTKFRHSKYKYFTGLCYATYMLGGVRKVRKAPQMMTGQLARLDSDGPALLLLAGLDTGLLDTRPGSPA